MGIVFPRHAYVPGHNERHPEDWFDDIKASVTADTPQTLLHKTEAFKAGIAYFEAEFFWECHEVLEAVWMQTADPSPERDMVQAMIQLANARLKRVMGKPRATLRLCNMVLGHLERCKGEEAILGLRVKDVAAMARATQIDANMQYKS